MKKRRTQSLHFWSKFDHPFLPEDGQNRKDIISDGEKLQPLGYPNISKIKAQPHLHFLGKALLLYAIFGLDFQIWLIFLVPRLKKMS